MGLTARLKAWLGSSGRTPSSSSSWFSFVSANGALTSPYAQNATAFAGVSALMRYVESVPPVVKRGTFAQRENGRPAPATDDWARLFARPAPKMTGPEFFGRCMAWTALEGEFFAIKFGEGSRFAGPGEKVRELYLVPPSCVMENLDHATDRVVSWTVSARGQSLTVPAESMWHYATFNPSNRHRGQSWLQASTVGMEGDLAAQQYQRGTLRNGGIASAKITLPAGTTPTEAADMKRLWDQRHAGPDNAGKVAVLKGGMDYVPLGMTAKDVGLEGFREFTSEQVKRCLGISEYDLGDIQDGNLASMRVAERATWTRTVLPWMTRVVESAWAEVFGGGTEWVEFDTSKVSALQAEFGEKLDNAAKLVGLGYSTDQANEKLELGMPPAPVVESPPIPEPEPEPVAKAVVVRKAAPLSEPDRVVEQAVSSALLVMMLATKARLPAEVPKAYGTKTAPWLARALGTPDEWASAMRSHVRPAIQRVQRIVARDAEVEFKASVAWDSPALQRAAKRRIGQMVDISRGYRRKLADTISREIAANGYDARAVAEAIERKFGDQITGHAETIARTEVAMLRNGVRETVAKDNGYRSKVWDATLDDVTRPAHAAMDRERVDIDDRFSNGMSYPAEAGAPAEEVINCRCVARYQKREP